MNEYKVSTMKLKYQPLEFRMKFEVIAGTYVITTVDVRDIKQARVKAEYILDRPRLEACYANWKTGGRQVREVEPR